MKVYINTYIGAYATTLPPLLSSLSASGVPNENIVVVIGGVTGSIDTSPYAVNVVSNSFDMFEFAALSYVADNGSDSEFIFNLQDTTIVDPKFWSVISGSNQLTSLSIITSMNMGVFPSALLRGFQPMFNELKKDMPYAQKRSLVCYYADYIFKRKACMKYFCSKVINQGMVDYYGTGVLDNRLYYSEIGLTKFLTPPPL